jgi:hypothetical protein
MSELSDLDPPRSRIISLLSEYCTNSQLNFWKQENEEQFLAIIEHTKKTFAVPTTSQECSKTFDFIKTLYAQLSEDEDSDDSDFIYKRLLLTIWSKDFDLFKD